MSKTNSTEQPPRAPRLTLSQIVEALLTRRPERSSVTLSRNARGATQVEVVVRSGDEGASTVDEAASKARALYDDLCTTYPVPGPPAEPKP